MTRRSAEYRARLQRWLEQGKGQLKQGLERLQEQLSPVPWPERWQRLGAIPDGHASRWQPRPGSSSAELALLLADLPLVERQLLASLLDAPSAGVRALVEAVERLQLDWRQRLDPLHSHREYAAQLETLVSLLGLPVAARSAYLENELRLFRELDSLLLESLPLRLRGELANRFVAGEGGLLRWWHRQLLARAGVPGYGVEGLGEEDWPDMPPAWFALGWIAGLRQTGDRDR